MFVMYCRAEFGFRGDSGVNDLQSEFPFEKVEIAVSMQQLVPGLDTKGCDQAVDSLAHRIATLAQLAVIQS
jgi:hypothetical protein